MTLDRVVCCDPDFTSLLTLALNYRSLWNRHQK